MRAQKIANIDKRCLVMGFDLQEWYLQETSENVILAHKGEITEELITRTLEEIESKLDDINETSKIRKRLYNVLVEALQNLYHHVDVAPNSGDDKQFAVFILTKDNGTYRIATGNFISGDKQKLLRDRIDQINYLSKDELKELYKLILNNEEFSEKGGGGLGMIDIARKTGNKLEYSFYSHSGDYYFFSLNVLVS